MYPEETGSEQKTFVIDRHGDPLIELRKEWIVDLLWGDAVNTFPLPIHTVDDKKEYVKVRVRAHQTTTIAIQVGIHFHAREIID